MKSLTKYFLLAALLTCVFVASTLAQDNAQDVTSINRVGTTAAQFLKIGAGARAIGMGGAYTALATDILSIYWNPAGLARINGAGEAIFNHAEWLADTDYDFAAFSLNAGNLGSFGFHVVSFRTPEEPVRTVRNPEGTGQLWDANSISLGATFSRNLTDRFSIGITAKYVQESLFNVTARGAAFDLGVMYDTPFENVTLGAAISNFGTKMQLDGRDLFFNEDPATAGTGAVAEVPAKFRTDNFDMPLNLKFGLAWRVVQTEDLKIVAVADGGQPNDNTEFVNSGVEVGLKNVIFLRGGYKGLFLENNEQGATFGAGLRYDAVGTNLRIDFGWADFGRLDDIKFVSFAIKY